MDEVKNVEGRYYPDFHPGWGGFAEELFHYTSRYYHATEVFLRHLAQAPEFSMSGYKAAGLNPQQRDMMAAVLACPPGPATARAVITLVAAVAQGSSGVDLHWQAVCLEKLDGLCTPPLSPRTQASARMRPDINPLDPFIALAERLQMPVAVNGQHVEVCMHTLAGHLDSANSTLRGNLHEAILLMHNAGFRLRNHPDLTHAEAGRIDDD